MAFFVILANLNVIFKGERVEIEKVIFYFSENHIERGRKVAHKYGIRFSVWLLAPKICPVEERSNFSDFWPFFGPFFV